MSSLTFYMHGWALLLLMAGVSLINLFLDLQRRSTTSRPDWASATVSWHPLNPSHGTGLWRECLIIVSWLQERHLYLQRLYMAISSSLSPSPTLVVELLPWRSPWVVMVSSQQVLCHTLWMSAKVKRDPMFYENIDRFVPLMEYFFYDLYILLISYLFIYYIRHMCSYRCSSPRPHCRLEKWKRA